MSEKREYFLVTRKYCEKCHGAGGRNTPVTNETIVCDFCNGRKYLEFYEPITNEEMEKCQTQINWNNDKPQTRLRFDRITHRIKRWHSKLS